MPATTATPITGHGISDAFRDAELLAAALDAGAAGPRQRGSGARGLRHETATGWPARSSTSPASSPAFPGPERFVELQTQLAVAIDDQAGELAARPSRAGAVAA